AAQVVALVDFDQSSRWREGERISAESYLQIHPVLQTDAECAAEIIYGEFLLREEAGESPTLGEYEQRFPQYASRLKLQIQLHRAMAERSSSDLSVPGNGSTGCSNQSTDSTTSCTVARAT